MFNLLLCLIICYFQISGDGAPLEVGFVECIVECFTYGVYIPALLTPFFNSYLDVIGDGHCGFRCISTAIRGSEDSYLTMRNFLLREIADPIYRILYGYEYDAAIARIKWTLHRPCPFAHWMHGLDLFGFATINNWAICVVSTNTSTTGRVNWGGSCTYLPLKAVAGVEAPCGVMWILHTGVHWLRIRLVGDWPMPPIHCLWATSREESVVGWDDLYGRKIAVWLAFF